MSVGITHARVLASAKDVCRQADEWTRADFYGDHRTDRKQWAEDSETPWRGLMSPPTRRLVKDMEDAGEYSWSGDS